MALLLIDNRTVDIPMILSCLESNVTPVIFDFEKYTFESLTEKIPEQHYTRLGILQENNSTGYCLIASFGESVLEDVEHLDPLLDSWTSFHLLLELCMSRLGVCYLDLIQTYGTSDWDYISTIWEVPIRSGGKNEWYGIYFRPMPMSQHKVNPIQHRMRQLLYK
jgi:hypothetical protein